MTIDVYPEPVFPAPAPVRPRLANRVMRIATRINWAEQELRGLSSIVRSGDSVIDVGAAHGMYTLPLAHLVGPTGRVDSFEPHPRQQRTLRVLRRLIGASHVNVNNFAVGDESGERTMRLPLKFGFPIYGHAHITAGATPLGPEVKNRQWTTSITTVDEWQMEHDISRVAFIKVDVEGFEPQVVLGATQTIARDRPSLLLEIEDRHLARYGLSANDFAQSINTRWPEYSMYVWRDEAWVVTDRVIASTRNYLFATDSAINRP